MFFDFYSKPENNFIIKMINEQRKENGQREFDSSDLLSNFFGIARDPSFDAIQTFKTKSKNGSNMSNKEIAAAIGPKLKLNLNPVGKKENGKYIKTYSTQSKLDCYVCVIDEVIENPTLDFFEHTFKYGSEVDLCFSLSFWCQQADPIKMGIKCTLTKILLHNNPASCIEEFEGENPFANIKKKEVKKEEPKEEENNEEKSSELNFNEENFDQQEFDNSQSTEIPQVDVKPRKGRKPRTVNH